MSAVAGSIFRCGYSSGVPTFSAVALVVGAALASSGCVFAPNIAPSGYVACAHDSDCEAGRLCSASDGSGVCAPPPWNDDKFEGRRLLVVENTDDAPMAKGTAVPVVVGGDLLQLADVASDFRVTDFDPASHAWKDVAVYVDRESDRFTIWIPLQRDIPQGKSDVLAWLESNTADQTPNVTEDPAAVFAGFDAFDTLDDTKWRIHGTPTVTDGVVNVADQQVIVLEQALAPPVSLTAVVRLNGITCDQVFVGLVGDDRSLLPVGPEAGLFVEQDLAAHAYLAAALVDTPTRFGDGITAKTTFQRVTVAVEGGAVTVADDDDVAYTDTKLHPAFGTDPLHLAVQVHGACSVDVDAAWVTPLPAPPPKITAGPLIQFQLFQ